MVVDEVIHGRRFSPADLREVADLLAAHPDWHRTGISRELCQRWDWLTATGRPKDMACRSLLLKLEARGWIRLPSRQRPRVNERRNRQPVQIELDRDILEASLASVQPLRIDLVESGSHEATLFRALLQRHHYLGLRNRVGENCDVGAKCTENERFEIHCRWEADGARPGGCGRRSQMTSAI